MTNQEFIKTIAPIVQKMTAKYGYGVNSAIIAQACLESAYGTSKKAQHHNYFGLKYRPNRVSCSSGMFKDGSQEQEKNGSYVRIIDNWFGFANMEKGVEGYLQFIAIDNYAAARKATEPRAYLQALKDAGYATSKAYVDNNMAVIEKWNLTQYDGQKKEVSTVSKPEITKMISKYNFESRSGNTIKYIVLHYTGNQSDTAKANANYFSGGNRGASAHYFVDDTSIYQSVEDANAAWHVGKNYGSGNLYGTCTNKNSIGIEMCSKNGVITGATIARAVLLTRYLMQLYGVPKDRVVRHYDVCSKSCPGWTGWIPKDESKWLAFKAALAESSTETKQEAKTSTPKTKTEAKTSKPTIEKAADNVIDGKYGNGDDRKKALKKLGFTDAEIKKIQNLVNQKLQGKTAAKTYTVKKGDTLSKIASKYGTTVSAIAKKNGISNPDRIYVGQVIKL